jgi:hypothetical protein
MELRLGIRERRMPSLDEVPTLRAADLRRVGLPAVGLDDGSLRVSVEAPSGQQEVVLVPDPRPFGQRYLALCACGRRTLFLRLQQASGWWRCAKCQKLRSARDRYRRSTTFNRVFRPLLDLDRLRRRTAHKFAPTARKKRFEEVEKRVLADVARAINGRPGGDGTTASSPAKDA